MCNRQSLSLGCKVALRSKAERHQQARHHEVAQSQRQKAGVDPVEVLVTSLVRRPPAQLVLGSGQVCVVLEQATPCRTRG